MADENELTPDTERELIWQTLHARVSPYGASLRGFWRETSPGQRDDIITGYQGAMNKVGGQGDVLIPFPGRVRGGKYTFNGQSYEMPQNDKDGPNAIHGFVRQRLWQETETNAHARTFTIDLPPDTHPGYPFALRATVHYALGPATVGDDSVDGLLCRFSVTNTGSTPAPVAVGFHPYFTVGSLTIDPDLLTLPMAAALEFENLLPTGRILPVSETPHDFLVPRPIGATAFNTCFCSPLRDRDGIVRIRLAAPNGDRTITVWMDDTFNYVVLYSGDPLPELHRRRSLAIEPMTCGSDAFNHPDWGLVALAPGETLTGTWGVDL